MGCTDDMNDCCECCECIDRSSRWIFVPVSIVIGFGLFLMVVLLPLSLQSVKFDEVALLYRKVSRSLETTVLNEGLHDVGPDGHLLILKRTQRQGDITGMYVLTSDGLEVVLDVDVLYSIVSDDAYAIIQKYYDQAGHDLYIMDIARSVVRDTVSEFTARSFFLQRQEVQEQMEKVLRARFNSGEAHASAEAVQLSNVRFGFTVQATLDYTTVVQQDIENSKFERATAELIAQNTKTLAEKTAELTLINALKTVAVTNLFAETDAAALGTKFSIRTHVYGNVTAFFGKGAPWFVSEYLRSMVLRANTGNTIIGLD